MFEVLLNECRGRFNRKGSSFLVRLGLKREPSALSPTDKIPADLRRHYQTLLESGEIVWGHVVQANQAIYLPGHEDLPGYSLFSTSALFDSRPQDLAHMAQLIFDLKGTTPADKALAHMAAIITDEFSCPEMLPVPMLITGGAKVFLSSTLFHRSRFPDNILSDGLYPLLICPSKTRVAMILPLSFWAPGLVDRWGELDDILAELPVWTKLPGLESFNPEPDRSPPPVAELEGDELVHVTPAAAKEMWQIALADDVTEFYAVLGVSETDDGVKHTVELTTEFDPQRQICVHSSGIGVLVAKEHLDELAGSVIEFRKSIYGTGFIVRNPNE